MFQFQHCEIKLNLRFRLAGLHVFSEQIGHNLATLLHKRLLCVLIRKLPGIVLYSLIDFSGFHPVEFRHRKVQNDILFSQMGYLIFNRLLLQ